MENDPKPLLLSIETTPFFPHLFWCCREANGRQQHRLIADLRSIAPKRGRTFRGVIVSTVQPGFIASPTSIDSGSGGDESAHQAASTCQPPQTTIVGSVQVRNSIRDQAFWCCCQKRSRTPAPSVFLEPHHATFHRRSVRGFEDWAMRCLSGQGMRYVL
ncbi:hypothetical protein M438DRAFT_407579 [Aureobasidium pullulans EXF-150]|uniref:Uncharacterized protein n=1 Tax=Aureobasidium pullulans EXF-150 TaxID=1043002 RepID=A0A074XDX0_AURPU|nr:uncharacterized protein M438DRAFT_407579 [Aureobasidium pullulans EXF-150]KEQ81929.1 hypothetical protein M438DRAFT_407579 [Aureobasidium pullulans EXF-150]